MRNPKILVALAAAGLLTAGCGSDSATSGSPGAGAAPKALPVAVNGPQPEVLERGGDALRVTPLPERGAPLVQQVEHNLREKILAFAKVPGETSAKCPDGVTKKAGAVSQCVVTYAGAEIPYEVKISDKYTEGSPITSYTATQKKGLLVAKYVYNELNKSYGAESGRTDASKLACEEIPAAKAVDWSSDTGYKCQWWSKHANEGDGGYETLQVKMGPAGVGFETVKAVGVVGAAK